MQKIADPQRTAVREIPKAQRRTSRSLVQWLSACDSREEALFRAHTESGLTMSAIAGELRLSVSRISRLIARAEGAKGKTLYSFTSLSQAIGCDRLTELAGARRFCGASG